MGKNELRFVVMLWGTMLLTAVYIAMMGSGNAQLFWQTVQATAWLPVLFAVGYLSAAWFYVRPY